MCREYNAECRVGMSVDERILVFFVQREVTRTEVGSGWTLAYVSLL
jgi:hypothetical protein